MFVSGICFLSGIMHILPASASTTLEQDHQAREVIGILTFCCIPALCWVWYLIKDSEK